MEILDEKGDGNLGTSGSCFHKKNLHTQIVADATLEKEAAIFKALGHPIRLAMVHALADGPRCVCELHGLVKAASAKDLSTISRHLSQLQQVGIIRSERRGTNIYYSLTLSCLGSFLQCTGLALQGVEHSSIL